MLKQLRDEFFEVSNLIYQAEDSVDAAWYSYQAALLLKHDILLSEQRALVALLLILAK